MRLGEILDAAPLDFEFWVIFGSQFSDFLSAMTSDRGEQLVTGDTRRRRISMTPASENQEDVRESHIWAAFQVYSYISSDHGLVFDSAVRIGRFWTDVSITSDSGTGGVSDKGVEGLRQWALDFGEKYSRICKPSRPWTLCPAQTAPWAMCSERPCRLFLPCDASLLTMVMCPVQCKWIPKCSSTVCQHQRSLP